MAPGAAILGRRRRRARIGRNLKDHTNPLEVFNREEIRQRFRFHPETIQALSHDMEKDLNSNRNGYVFTSKSALNPVNWCNSYL